MRKKSNISINKLYSVIALSMFIVTITIFSYVFYKFKKDFLKIHITNQEKLVSDFINYFNEKFENQLQFLSLLKYNDKQNFKNLKYFSNIFIVDLLLDQVKDVIKSRYNPKILIGMDTSYLNNLPLIKLKNSKNLFITPLYYSEFSGKEVISVILPIDKDDLYIVGELDFKSIVKNIFKRFANREDIIIITDLNNNFIDSSHPNFYFPKINFTEIKFHNKIYTVIGKVFPKLSIKIFYLSPLATSLQILLQNIIIVIFILLLLLFFTYMYINQKLIINPLNNIVSQLSSYPDTYITTKSKIKEIFNIIEKFNFARDKINNVIKSQKQILRFLDNIFNSSPLPIIILDKNFNTIYSNQVAQKLFTENNFGEIIRKEFFNEIITCLKEKNINKVFDRKINGKIFDIIFYPLTLEEREEIVCVLTDQTEKKALQEKLIEAQKVETIGLFAGGLAHDLNNIIQSILFSVEIMKQHLDSKEKLENYISKIEKSIEVAMDLLYRLRSYAKLEEVGESEIDFKEIIYDTLIIVNISMPYFIKIKTKFDISDNYLIIGDKFELTQVLMNLILNARDAIVEAKRENGVIEIEMKKEKEHLIIKIKDNGIGIKEENLDKIFNVFFSTKGYVSKEKGSGLGLSITKKIIEKYKGKIEVESEENKGTTFTITFPLIK